MVSQARVIDPSRHLKIFSPDAFGQRRVDVVGCGATGSRIALSLAKLGVKNLHLWDFDVIEEHNIANQAFGNDQIGQLKVLALKAMIEQQTGLVATPHDEAVTGRTQLGSVVFVLTDTMSSRKEIWEGAIRYKPHVNLMIETRMGIQDMRVYTVNPLRPADCKMWESRWYEDEVSTESLCGSRTTVGPTAELLSGFAVWQFLQWNTWQKTGQDAPHVELLFDRGGLFQLTNPKTAF